MTSTPPRQTGPAGLAFAAGLLAILSLTATASRQQGPSGVRPVFEAATVKLAPPDAIRNRVMPTAPNRLSIPSMSLVWLVYAAYGDGGFNTAMRVEGGPEWTNRTAFAIEGIALGTPTPLQRRQMLQTLLEERFALKTRTETRVGTTLTLVLDRSDGTLGPKVKPWDGTCRTGPLQADDEPTTFRCSIGYRPGGALLEGVTMYSVAEFLSLPPSRALLGTITHDRTGLTGRYTMDIDFPFGAQRPADPTAPADAGPSLATAIREQWGLRVVPGQGTLKVVTIESAQPPTAN